MKFLILLVSIILVSFACSSTPAPDAETADGAVDSDAVEDARSTADVEADNEPSTDAEVAEDAPADASPDAE